jgi:hypothetical protein
LCIQKIINGAVAKGDFGRHRHIASCGASKRVGGFKYNSYIVSEGVQSQVRSALPRKDFFTLRMASRSLSTIMTNLLRCDSTVVLLLLLLFCSSPSLVTPRGLLSSTVLQAQRSRLLPRQLQSDNSSTVTLYTGQPQCDGKNGSLVSLAKAPFDTSLNVYAAKIYQPTCSCEQVPYNGPTVLGPLESLAPTNTSTIVDLSIFLANYNPVFVQLENYIAYTCLNTCETCYTNVYCGIYNTSFSYLHQGGEANFTVEESFPVSLENADLITGSIPYMKLLTLGTEVCLQYTMGFKGIVCFSQHVSFDFRGKVNLRAINCTVTYNNQVCNSCALLNTGDNITATDSCFVGDCSNLATAESNETLVWNTCLNQDTSVFQGRFSLLKSVMGFQSLSDFGTLGRCEFPSAAPTDSPTSALNSPSADFGRPASMPTTKNDKDSNTAPVAIIAGITVPLVALILLALGYFILRTKKEEVANLRDEGTSQGGEGGAPGLMQRDDNFQAAPQSVTGSVDTAPQMQSVATKDQTSELNTSGPTMLPDFKDQTRSMLHIGPVSPSSGYPSSVRTDMPLVTAVAVPVFPDTAADDHSASASSSNRHRLEP